MKANAQGIKIRQKTFIACLFLCMCLTSCSHAPTHRKVGLDSIISGIKYDAREFLSREERQHFNIVYPEFDSKILEKDWEWKDVDPLALFTAQENRIRRREIFLYDYSPYITYTKAEAPDPKQMEYRNLLEGKYPEATIQITKHSVKIILPYNSRYEVSGSEQVPKKLLELSAGLGLRWADYGGTTLYLYNGSILLTKYSAGYIMLANPDIDSPN